MKRSVFALAIALIVVVGASAFADDREDLARLLDDFLAGVDRAEVHDAFWADDLVYTSSRGTRTTKADIMRGFDAARPPDDAGPATAYSAEDVQIKLFGDVAVVAFRLVAGTAPVGRDAEPPARNVWGIPAVPERRPISIVSEYLNTGTFVKRDGRWRAVAWQATKIPD